MTKRTTLPLADVEQSRAVLAAVVDRVEAGELSAGDLALAHLHGSLSALDAVLTDR